MTFLHTVQLSISMRVALGACGGCRAGLGLLRRSRGCRIISIIASRPFDTVDFSTIMGVAFLNFKSA